MEFTNKLDAAALAAYHREQPALEESWEVTYSTAGMGVITASYDSEEAAMAAVREVERFWFAPISGWHITAKRVTGETRD